MNFFAHFLIDHKPNQPIFNCALIAPDIIRSFTPDNKRFNWEHIQQDPNSTALLKEFAEGCLQHIQRDKQFHDSPMFHEIYQECRTPWKEISIEIDLERFWFSLHVTVEMIIDKILISNNLEKLKLFYQTMNDQAVVYENILNQQNYPHTNYFLERYNRFCESKYLFHYQQPEKIAYALHRIHQSLGISTPWHENNNHLNLLVSVINQTENTIKNHRDFHTQMQQINLP